MKKIINQIISFLLYLILIAGHFIIVTVIPIAIALYFYTKLFKQ